MNRKRITRIICFIMAILMLASLVLFIVPVIANADSVDDQLEYLQEQKEEKAAAVEAANNKLAKLKEEQAEVVEQKLALEERNDAAEQELTVVQKQIDLYTQMITAKNKEVEIAQQKENEQLEKYRTRIRAMEENGDYNILALILNANSFSELLSSMDDYGDVMDSDKTLYDEFIEARQNLEDVKASYEKYKDECDQKLTELEAEQKDLIQQIKESEKTIEELNEKIKEAEEEQKAADAALSAANASVTSFLSSYYAQKEAAAESGQTTYTDEDTGVTYDTSTQYSDSGYIWPFPASHSISSGYKMRWGKLHSGVDIDGFNNEGSPIVASRGGTVILAGWNGGYGNCVMIDHGDAVTLYGHMSYISVSVGQAVTAGTTVGGCGMTGSATGVHLHFEIRINGSTIDPLPYLPAGYTLEDGALTES